MWRKATGVNVYHRKMVILEFIIGLTTFFNGQKNIEHTKKKWFLGQTLPQAFNQQTNQWLALEHIDPWGDLYVVM